MDQNVERCNLCILPKTSQFCFDERGICALCIAAAETPAGEQAARNPLLDDYIEKIRLRGRGRPFDCVVGVSGGRDSSYLLYLLTRKHGLRCLATYYRTPFTSDTTDANVKRLTKILGVPLAELAVSSDYHRRIAKEFTVLWSEKPQPVIANMACAPCKLINREVFRLARAQGVSAVIYGGNRFESVQIAPGAPANETMTTSTLAAKQFALGGQLRKGLQLTQKGLGALRMSSELWRYIPLGVQSSIMYICPHTAYLRFRYPSVFAFEYFCFGEWDQAESEKALAELHWELPLGCNSTWKSDCSFAELKNYMFRKMTGITYMDAFLSNMVRAGVITREEAIKRIDVEGRTSAVRLADACAAMGLPGEFSGPLLRDAG